MSNQRAVGVWVMAYGMWQMASLLAFATPPTSGQTTLMADAVASAGGFAGSSATSMPVSQLGSWIAGRTGSGATSLYAGYVEVACHLAVCVRSPAAGAITVEGEVIDVTASLTVTIRNETLNQDIAATVTQDVNDPSLWIFTSDHVSVIEGENILTATATDAAGNAHSHTITITYDATPPPRPTLDPVESPRSDPVVDLSGQKAAETAIWINGEEQVPRDALTTWTVDDYVLAEGINTLAITAQDAAQNPSAPLTAAIVVDAEPPNFSLSLAPDEIYYDPEEAQYYTSLTALLVTVEVTTDDVALVEILVDSANPVEALPTEGSQAGDGQSPDTYLATVSLAGEGTATLEAHVTSLTNQLVIGPPSSVEVDQTAPDAPGVDAYAAITTVSPVSLTGTKESGAGLFRNSMEVLQVGDDTIAWSEDVTLVEGPNSFAYTQEDRAGNVSLPTSVSITYDPTAPTQPVVTDDGATTPDATQLHASATSSEDWTSIVNWCWSVGTAPGLQDVLAETCTGQGGTSSEVTLAIDPPLVHGTTYYLNATAINDVALVSEVGSSDGIVPSQPPQVTSVSPPHLSRYYVGEDVIMTVTATDPDNDTLTYRFRVNNQDTGEEEFRRDFSSSNQANWDTTGEDPGVYHLFVDVQDEYGASTTYGGDTVWEISLRIFGVPLPPDE